MLRARSWNTMEYSHQIELALTACSRDWKRQTLVYRTGIDCAVADVSAYSCSRSETGSGVPGAERHAAASQITPRTEVNVQKEGRGKNNTPDKADLAYLLPGVDAPGAGTQSASLTPIREHKIAAGSQIVRQMSSSCIQHCTQWVQSPCCTCSQRSLLSENTLRGTKERATAPP